MSNQLHSKHPLIRKGTSQAERYPIALQKDYVKIDERTFHDFIKQSAELSKYFQYYESNKNKSEDSWRVFFKEIYDFDNKQVRIKKLEELEKTSSMAPHLALFFSFLKLFELSIEQLNGLGEKHLLFFYKQMLRLELRSPIRPRVTLIGELAKDVTDVLIPQETAFKAGKNTFGEDIVYHTEEDIILNQARVSALRTVNFLDDKIRLRRISNSADGGGEPFEQEPYSWSAFGKATDTPCEVGFCIASPFLNINEGTRKLSLHINNVDLNDFDVFISVENGWQTLVFSRVGSGPYTVSLAPSFPKIVAIDQKIHSTTNYSIHPVLKFTIKGANKTLYFKYVNHLANMNLTIDYANIKDLSVKNELGKIDVSKPFQPFGSTSSNVYSALYIGHPILFSKYTTSISIKQDNKVVSNSGNVLYLNSGVWEAAGFTGYDVNFDKEYGISTKNNYIKIKNTFTTAPSNEFTVTITDVSTVKKIKIVPPASNILTWQDLTLTAKVSINPTQKEAFSLYHLHPFEVVLQQSLNKLLPTYQSKSYFFIGIENLRFGQRLSLHFEILEGSGDQDLKQPPITWNIYQSQQLVALNNEEIVKDSTLQFLQSGNVQFSLRKERFDTSESNNLLWLVASCSQDYKAIPDFLAVLPQAFTAHYVMPANNYVVEIQPGSIKKPEVTLSGLKKITQRYKSYGGRPLENKEQFILRSSERLRHKGVAITIFDYERLLLEKFPFLYQVKCISHSTASSHQAPGNVLVIVVPKLKKDNSQEELKPKVSVGNREVIKQFLTKIISPFVKIDVRNPNYYEVKIEVNVQYYPQFELDKEHYNAILNKRLQAFISPWLENEQGVEFNKVGYRSQYINFIEEQEFVDHITLFNLYINNIKIEDKLEFVREDVVFTSVSNHIIRNDDLC